MKLLRKVYRKVYRLYYKGFLFFNYLNNRKQLNSKQNWNGDIRFSLMKSFIDSNADVTYHVCKENIPTPTAKYKWVGAQSLDGEIICIPNDETNIIIGKNNKWESLGAVREGLFKWTGGCIWNNSVYCFPRTSNSFLKINHSGIAEIPLEYEYQIEHHYSGVCTKDGVVYQPPRNTSHILKTNLETGKSEKIEIINEKFRIKLSYCGSIIHPNGYIYFFPVCEDKVIKLDPRTDQWCYIGKRITTYCFDAKVAYDGNIYGFNNFNGILKINVNDDTVENIHLDIPSYAYGTKQGVNGKLYSIPARSQYIYEYDIKTDSINIIEDINDRSEAKYAGGLTNNTGTIYGIPARSNDIIKYIPSRVVNIPNDLYITFYVDNY